MSSSSASSVTNSPSRHSAHSAQGVLAVPGSPVIGGRFASPHIGSIDSGEMFIDAHTDLLHTHIFTRTTHTHSHTHTHTHALTHNLSCTHTHTHTHTAKRNDPQICESHLAKGGWQAILSPQDH